MEARQTVCVCVCECAYTYMCCLSSEYGAGARRQLGLAWITAPWLGHCSSNTPPPFPNTNTHFLPFAGLYLTRFLISSPTPISPPSVLLPTVFRLELFWFLILATCLQDHTWTKCASQAQVNVLLIDVVLFNVEYGLLKTRLRGAVCTNVR